MADVNFGSYERKNLILIIIAAVFAVYAVKLFQMQIIHGEKYNAKASNNSIKTVEVTPIRGVFYDRDMELVVQNNPAYAVSILPFEYDTTNNILLETVLDLESGTIDSILHDNKTSRYIPVKIKMDVDFETVGWLLENEEHLPGVKYEIEVQRGYPAEIMASHLFGYTREITRSRLKKEDEFYKMGDIIGYSGIERSYEEMLRGKKGYEFIVVDSKRKEIGRFMDGNNDIEPVRGRDLILTIDADVQRVAEQLLEGKSGAVVAIEPGTGEILCMASAPDYDLNEFAYITSREYLDTLSADTLKPQFNRATMSVYPPGSTFKVMMAIAGLDMGVITERHTEYCRGAFIFGRVFGCHGIHGRVAVVEAIERSCNVFFYNLIFDIGLDNLAAYANKFGFGHKTGVDLNEESPGIIPTTLYYEQLYGKNWPEGNLVSLGIGQGEISVTPLQLANFTALVANDGVSGTPHFVKGYLDPEGDMVEITYPDIITGVNPGTLEIVKEGMYKVVNGDRGTARGSRIYGVDVAGKTGTAQNPHGEDHALFIAFAPFENPRIAVAVVVENSGFGSTHAAPVAKKIIETYLSQFPEFNIEQPIFIAQGTGVQQVEDTTENSQ